MELTYAATALFALGAVLGLYLLFVYVLKGKKTPKNVAFLHGPLGGVGLMCLLFYAGAHGVAPWTAIVLFSIAALGGIVLIFKDLTGNSVPKWLAVVHGLIATSGLIALVVFEFAGS